MSDQGCNNQSILLTARVTPFPLPGLPPSLYLACHPHSTWPATLTLPGLLPSLLVPQLPHPHTSSQLSSTSPLTLPPTYPAPPPTPPQPACHVPAPTRPPQPSLLPSLLAPPPPPSPAHPYPDSPLPSPPQLLPGLVAVQAAWHVPACEGCEPPKASALTLIGRPHVDLTTRVHLQAGRGAAGQGGNVQGLCAHPHRSATC